MALRLGDLDDFLSPSDDCIKPLIEAASSGPFKLDATDARGPINRLDYEAPQVQVQKPNLIKSKKSKEDPKAQIGQVTLSDCLACSGCVTSAETVLLQQQSGEEFLRRVSTTPLTVVSISGEARTSLATHFNASPLETMQKIAGALNRLGVAYVLESSAAEALALLEGEAEFMQRFQRAQVSTGASSKNPQESLTPMPLLTSHCPGWTCYAEKVVEPVVLPHLSPLRPPQQMQGRLVKTCLLEAHNRHRFQRWWRSRSPLFAVQSWRWCDPALQHSGFASDSLMGCSSLTPADVYHVSVQPCFDRKIEASRPQFEALDAAGVREVDTVLTTTELLELLQKDAPDCDQTNGSSENLFEALPSCNANSGVFTDLLLGSSTPSESSRPPLICAVRGANAGAGGFVEHVFRGAARKLFQMQVDSPLVFKTSLNEDMKEVTLEDPSSQKVLLRFVSAYGFRNIQNVIRRLTKPGANLRKECGDFVEIMACPGACLNGGGQVVPPKVAGAAPTKNQRKERLDALEALLHSGDGIRVVPPAEHPLVLPLYQYVVAHAEKVLAKGTSHKRAHRSPNGNQSLDCLIGSEAVKTFFEATWKSLKVDDDGKALLGTSALKW